MWLLLVPPLVAWALSSRAGAQGTAVVLAQPMLGTADAQTVMMGAAGAETWAYRVLPAELGGRLAFLRHTDASGWQVAETVDAQEPNRASPRITPGGGGLLVTRGAVLVREPGGTFQPAPPATVSGQVIDAAIEENGRLRAFLGAGDEVLSYFDGAWTREPIETVAAD